MTHIECAIDATSYHDRRLNEFRAAVAHPQIAVAAEMDYCAEVGISPPRWLTEAAAHLVCELLRPDRPKPVGRASGPIRSYRQHMLHLERWFAVHAVRDIASKVRRDKKILKEHGKRFSKAYREKYGRELERRAKWLKQGIWTCASLYLSGNESFVGPHTVKASYLTIERMNADPQANQSCIFELSFLGKLGLGLHDRGQGKKLLKLFDLTA